MRKLSAGVVLIALLSLAAPSWTDAQAAGSAMKTYRHIQGFSIRYPGNWEVRENLDFQGFKIPLLLLEPLQGPSDNFQENLNVIIENTSRPYSTDEYLKASMETMKKSLNSFTGLNVGAIQSPGLKGKYLVYTHKVDQVPGLTKVIVFFYVKGTKAFDITCSATEKEFDAHLKLFMEMGKSFQLI